MVILVFDKHIWVFYFLLSCIDFFPVFISEKECKEDEFKCSNSRKCIDIKWKCDGDFDCSDHSDENDNCTYNPIDEAEVCHPTTEFQCKNSKECIHNSWKCDGDPDCTDGTDEGDFCNFSITLSSTSCQKVSRD